MANLALSVAGLTEYGVIGTPGSGAPRIVTFTNTGGHSAVGFMINFPIWPAGTTAVTTCGSTLAAGGSCTVTITGCTDCRAPRLHYPAS